MSERKELGKIKSIRVGLGGYQDAMIGIWLDLGGESWGVGAGEGQWSIEHSAHCKWTEADRIHGLGQLMMTLAGWLKQAKKDHAQQLIGVPVEVTFVEFNKLKSWRILEEVL